ncbi:complex I intermediate-associated protein 30, mitochondrial [Trichonephila clavata]|uniref:Complex I intermediate-associated protein 30, mitochondrial n=1 Tax=Trichonephila clavata TaxID=2740835 RepID=A0A8X6I2A6_TRICU|nr:complex I intermediate-associated protein 30, mitochondrial [Trichonephila clavata]
MRNISGILKLNSLFTRGLERKFPIIHYSCIDHQKSFSQTQVQKSVFERDSRGSEYPVFPFDKKHWTEHMKDGGKIFVEECKLFVEEVKEHFLNDPKFYNDGDTDVFFRFDSKDCLQKWRLGSDKMYNEGFSDCSLEVNDRGKGVFYGNIDTTPPKDGKNRFAGYCGIKSVKKQKSFLRDDWYDWIDFTHIEMRVRGDGRNYMINLGLGMYYDVNWFDTFTYVLHTRGGPYWEVVRIPFSKFILTSKGRVHDKPQPLPLDKVNSVGITCAAVSGPFHLEIDYIGCHKDESYKEKTAYELYQIPKEFVSC